MSFRTVVVVLAGGASIAAGTFLATRAAYSQEGARPSGGAMPSEEEIWKMLAERGAPVDEHRKLAALAGTWDAEIDCSGCGDPGGAAAKPSKGTWTSESLLGGRLLLSRYEGDLAGRPYQGVELRGYDKEKQRHWAIWCDSMSTGGLRSLGERAADGAVALRSEEYDCMGMTCVLDLTKKSPDADHQSLEMVCRSPGAPDQTMKIRYTRRK